ncbi:MAG TPA: ParA family protein, partial [Anaerolineaceae bacterium]|nr:ParA family protein [Anaerolineaceae bacterium]
MTRIYTFVNQKGGVGKTTSAINIAAYMGYYGQRVLLVDLDPQANATSSLGIDQRMFKDSIYQVLIGTAPIAPQILHNPRFHISLLPSSPDLAGAEIELLEMEHRESRLRDALSAISSRYDYILIDCPPSLSILTLNGLVAAQDGVLIPLQCEFLALVGLGQLTQTINRVRGSLFPGLKIRGVFLTMFDGRTRLAQDVATEVREHFPNQVFHTVIPRSIKLAEAPSHGKPILYHAPEILAAREYALLTREILTQDGAKI